MNIIIVGYGAIGKERHRVLNILGENVIATLDINDTLTDELISQADWIFVCTPHDTTVDIVKQINGRIKVLVEKPYLGTLPVDNVGLNYRFYKGINQLLIDCHNRFFGDLISVNMVLALGDSPTAVETWRLDPKRAGRGATLDPGIHLIDIALLISEGELFASECKSYRGFWNTGIEEESHILSRDARTGTIYNFMMSKVHWRPTLRIEVNGTEGYGIVEGRNRFYGRQTYIRGKRWGWLGGKPQRESEELIVDYDGEDSFLEETKAVLYGTDSIIKPATYHDNLACLDFIKML